MIFDTRAPLPFMANIKRRLRLVCGANGEA
jgi:hypothetical protein